MTSDVKFSHMLLFLIYIFVQKLILRSKVNNFGVYSSNIDLFWNKKVKNEKILDVFCEICEVLQNIILAKDSWVTASDF